MPQAHRTFCSLARHYALLERLAFGSRLQQARTAFLDRMTSLETILILGEGDGRFLDSLLRVNPRARITCIDSSQGMIDRARNRIELLYPEINYNINWQSRDALEASYETDAFDAIVTLFFLDCFTPDDTERLIRRLEPAARSDCRWLWADFVQPEDRWPAMFARTTQGLLYRFFRWRTGIRARRLPPVHELMRRNGWQRSAHRQFLFGTIESAVWKRPGSTAHQGKNQEVLFRSQERRAGTSRPTR